MNIWNMVLDIIFFSWEGEMKRTYIGNTKTERES